MTTACPAFWISSPAILWTQAGEFFPFTENDKRCTAAALNSFTRFGLYLGIVLAVVRMDWRWLTVGIVFGLFATGAWFFMGARGSVREGFSDDEEEENEESVEAFSAPSVPLTAAPILTNSSDLNGRYLPDVIGMQGRTGPTPANPFMNVLISEISDNPYRDPAAWVEGEETKATLDNYFTTMFANNPGDVFNHTQSQRQFVTMPVTTIPNDQGAFADWLYRVPGRTYKEGNTAAGPFYTTGAELYPWRSVQVLT
jgi:hypothetical protein